MAKAFAGQKQEIDGEGLTKLLQAVLSRLSQDDVLTVELVQDEVERVLMESGWYDVAKAYILYREKQSVLRRLASTRGAGSANGATWAGMKTSMRFSAVYRRILVRKAIL